MIDELLSLGAVGVRGFCGNVQIKKAMEEEKNKVVSGLSDGLIERMKVGKDIDEKRSNLIFSVNMALRSSIHNGPS